MLGGEATSSSPLPLPVGPLSSTDSGSGGSNAGGESENASALEGHVAGSESAETHKVCVRYVSRHQV